MDISFDFDKKLDDKDEVVKPRIEIFDISADISAIYRISAYSEAIFATENRLEEKSKKIVKCRRYLADISVSDRNFGEISVSKTRARG